MPEQSRGPVVADPGPEGVVTTTAAIDPVAVSGPATPPQLSERLEKQLQGLFAAFDEAQGDAIERIDPAEAERAFRFAAERHIDQTRRSGEEFITHPVEVAKICAQMRLDTATICAALLHDTVEDTSASLDEIKAEFGEEIAVLVDGVTKLTGMTFRSRDEAQAQNYRKMMVAMATDVRVILVKLADRLHNMRTIGALPKQKQIEKSSETLDIYAPLAHRLGIHSIKWELEDLAFATLHPRKYAEIKALVNQQRNDREQYVDKAGNYLRKELQAVGIEAEITGRAKHFYSIYAKMTRKGREFNEIYDLTAMRVIVGSVKDCYGAVGIIHSLWKPLPGRFKDWVAMPKSNMYQALHTTVIGPEGRPLEIQIRTGEMHNIAEFGVAAHWIYKGNALGPARDSDQAAQFAGDKVDWLRALLEDGGETPKEFVESLKIDLFEDDVYVFTPKGEVKSLAAGATPLDFAYEVHTDVGHRCVGAKVNGKIVPLHYELQSGDIVEVLTSKNERGPSRDWLSLVKTNRARSKIRAFLQREQREGSEHQGRELLQDALRKKGLPAQKIVASPLLAYVMREVGFRKADEFYVALGRGKVTTRVVVTKLMNRLKEGEAAVDEEPRIGHKEGGPRQVVSASTYGISVDGISNVLIRLAKCCRPVSGDPIVGYVSLGKGITVHRTDCRNAQQLCRNEDRLVKVAWEGANSVSFRVEVEVTAWDRSRLLEDLSRAFSEAGANIIEARCNTSAPMVRDRFVLDVADATGLKAAIAKVRTVDGVFDAYRVTPGAASID